MQRLINFSVKAYQSRLAYIIRHTLRVMFPLILVGSFASVLRFNLAFSELTKQYNFNNFKAISHYILDYAQKVQHKQNTPYINDQNK